MSWPYAPRFHATPEGRLHYVDEGRRDAPAIVCLHGNPTWSYLYRHVIAAALERELRVVAVDHLGFGRSDKPDDLAAYAFERHAGRLAGILDGLGLHEPTVVAHDWGGPIGLPWAARHAARIVLLNTFAPRLPGPMGERLTLRALRAPGLGSFLVRRRAVMTESFLFDSGMAHPERLTDEDRRAYREPHPDARSRAGILAFPRMVPLRARGPVVAAVEQATPQLATIPTMLVWGTRDVLFGREVLDLWRRALPHAEVVALDDAGHYVAEDAPHEVAQAVARFACGASARV